MNRAYAVSLASILSIALCGVTNAQNAPQMIESGVVMTAPNSPSSSSLRAAFAPKARTDKRRLDYQVWDDILQNIIIDFGVSSRIRASRPTQSTGTRAVTGHTSPYRLEGSRVAFGFLDDNYRKVLTEYRESLQETANSLDITRMSRDEQLAFWLNLHNVTLIEQISKEYPEDVPSTALITVNGVESLIDDAKVINIRGHALSLRNIREDIVYPNWSDPKVIYGFFRGDIGSPRMMRLAFTANNLEYRLNGNANEFVNSLRGFHKGRKARKVSELYKEVARFYFPNWQTDIEAHLKVYAEGETLEDLAVDRPFETDKYETKVADLSGGRRASSGINLDGGSGLAPETARLLSEVGQKQLILRKRNVYTGLNRGYVIIEDIVSDPVEDTGNSIK